MLNMFISYLPLSLKKKYLNTSRTLKVEICNQSLFQFPIFAFHISRQKAQQHSIYFAYCLYYFICVCGKTRNPTFSMYILNDNWLLYLFVLYLLSLLFLLDLGYYKLRQLHVTHSWKHVSLANGCTYLCLCICNSWMSPTCRIVIPTMRDTITEMGQVCDGTRHWKTFWRTTFITTKVYIYKLLFHIMYPITVSWADVQSPNYSLHLQAIFHEKILE